MAKKISTGKKRARREKWLPAGQARPLLSSYVKPPCQGPKKARTHCNSFSGPLCSSTGYGIIHHDDLFSEDHEV